MTWISPEFMRLFGAFLKEFHRRKNLDLSRGKTPATAPMRGYRPRKKKSGWGKVTNPNLAYNIDVSAQSTWVQSVGWIPAGTVGPTGRADAVGNIWFKAKHYPKFYVLPGVNFGHYRQLTSPSNVPKSGPGSYLHDATFLRSKTSRFKYGPADKDIARFAGMFQSPLLDTSGVRFIKDQYGFNLLPTL